MDEIVDRVFQDIIDYTHEKNAYSDLENITSRSSSILSMLAGSFFRDVSLDGSVGARLMAKVLFLNFRDN